MLDHSNRTTKCAANGKLQATRSFHILDSQLRLEPSFVFIMLPLSFILPSSPLFPFLQKSRVHAYTRGT